MTTRLTRLTVAALMGFALWLAPADSHAQTAEARYSAAKERDDKVRGAIRDIASDAPVSARTPVITESRAVIAAYEALVRAHRASGYADNALYNAATLADALHDRFGLTTDRDAALRLFKRLRTEYPTAPLAKQSLDAVARLEEIATANAPVVPAFAADAGSKPVAKSAPDTRSTATANESKAANRKARQVSASSGGRARLLAIERQVMPQLVRVTIALDREVSYNEETLTGPARVFFDLRDVEAAPSLVDAVLRYPSEIVRQIRVGRHPNMTRVVLDLEGVGRHSVYTLYNPFRVVIDAEPVGAVARTANTFTAPPASRSPAAAPANAPAAPAAPLSIAESPVIESVVADGSGDSGRDEAEPVTGPLPAAPAPAPAAPPAAPPVRKTGATAAPNKAAASSATGPVLPSAPVAPISPRGNAMGGFSIARQLGLGISRIVIDPGHGGHDPGAQVRGLNEADLTLDIALRLEKLLKDDPSLEVILTRRTDVYIPLEERTAIANREGADLFLSIHANTSRNSSASGVETYFLSFAGSADAEAVAARENASSAGEMHKLPDIIRAITLNNKLDESRDLAGMVQEALVTRLRRSNKTLTNRGVKKAPFVVLIGAEMPSVLAEVSFMTNKQDLQLLKTPAYKQRIAEALQAAVMRYRRSLKGVAAAAAQ